MRVNKQTNAAKQENLNNKGTGKGSGKAPTMPQAMLGTCAPKTEAGVNICFGFNLKTCPHRVAVGTSCPRELHACAKLKNGFACEGEHAFTDCR